MRGDALSSILPMRGVFMRPLLEVGREELRSWLFENDIAWRDDPTNEDTRFERNWVRHTLLPAISSRRPGVAAVLARSASRALDDERLLDALAGDVLDQALVDDVGIFVAELDLVPSSVKTRVIRTACRRLGVDPRSGEVQTLERLHSGHVRCREIDVWRISNGLAFIVRPMPLPNEIVIDAPIEIVSSEWGVRLGVEAPEQLLIRSRKAGDRMRLPGGTRKVQDVLVDAKIPRFVRDLVPILATSSGSIAMVSSLTTDDVLRASPVSSLSLGAALRASPVVQYVEPFKQTWSRELAWIS